MTLHFFRNSLSRHFLRKSKFIQVLCENDFMKIYFHNFKRHESQMPFNLWHNSSKPPHQFNELNYFINTRKCTSKKFLVWKILLKLTSKNIFIPNKKNLAFMTKVYSHAVGMAVARPYGFKIDFVTLFLDQLHYFSLLPLNSFLQLFF